MVLQNVASYYLDCISRDRDDGISVYATNKYGNPDYGQIFSLPFQSVNSVVNSQAVSNIINKARKSKFSNQLVLGYPLFIRWARSKAGNPFAFVEPLLYQTFDLDDTTSSISPSDDPIRINPDAIGHLANCNKREVIYEILSVANGLNLDGPLEEQPDIAEAAFILRKIRSEWCWAEDIDPHRLSSLDLSQVSQECTTGIYNCAAFFVVEKSLFTQGLEQELGQLRDMSKEDQSSILFSLMMAQIPDVQLPKTTLIEPLPLNDEQRLAVKSALVAPLTVITGPPGTGKSQVVSSIIINSVFQGQKVLFASKNNKAVDVVLERVNSLSNRKVMIRLGRDSDGRDLRGQLVEYLNGLLSYVGNDSDKQRLMGCEQRHQELLALLEQISINEDRVIGLRNQVDQLERSVETSRIQLSDRKFYKFCTWDSSKIVDNETQLINLKTTIERSDINKQSMLIKLLWPLLKGSRLNELNQVIRDVSPLISELDIATSNEFSAHKSEVCYDAYNQVQKRFMEVKQISQYYSALKVLQDEHSLFEISAIYKKNQDQLVENSNYLWDSWLRLLPNRLSQEDRRCVGEFAGILQQLNDMGANSNPHSKKLWANYYRLLPRVSNILPCWAVTSLSARNRVPFEEGLFDLVVIDEASQCDIASAIPLLYRAKRAVIIGDIKQLKHISTITPQEDQMLLERYNLDVSHMNWSYRLKSLFELAQGLVSPKHLIDLKDHHRSHADIIEFSNKFFYDGNLRINTKYEQLKTLKGEPAVRWIDVNGEVKTPSTGGAMNEREAQTVVEEIKRIVKGGYKGTIGVVSPFRAQVNRIRDIISSFPNLEGQLGLHDFMVETVHKFQGDERDIMLFSPVLSNGISTGSAHFLSSTGNLFNVSLTRARAALVVIGDVNYCGSGPLSPQYMREFVNYQRQVATKFGVDANALMEYEKFGPEYPAISSSEFVSNWEKVLYKALYSSGIRTLPQYKVMQYSLDFALIKGDKKLDIEVDGEHYHRDWNGELCRRDRLRNQRLIELGWDVMRFWVYEIRDDLPGCIRRVKEWAEANKEV